MPRPIILDTNLLVLLVTGLTNPDYIAKHKRLQAYNKEDFRILERILEAYSTITLCPNVLSETSNLLRHMVDPIRSELLATMHGIVRNVGEEYVESRVAMERADYHRLGLADVVLMQLAETGVELLTDDLALYLAALGRGLPATNYNHLRDARPDYA
jgi:predicted nucleic acid-binding protein